MIAAPRRRAWSILALACAAAVPGCSQFGSRQRLDESRRTIQSLRSENDQLKDELLTFRNQNEDYSERAVDDARRLTAQSTTIENLRGSVHAYQAEHEDLKTAFRELRDSLPAAVRSAMSESGSRVALGKDDQAEASDVTPPTPEPAPRTDRRKPMPTRLDSPQDRRFGWAPAAEPSREAEPALDASP
ncbi:hypothetical protein [Paludisphaera mucosa]|uniref:Chromosome partition protein Smc n=1 Tax=Paludisphaera mucosa TaxID=3030827 RepID=A0ABT6F6Z6_9BACT|nr:hypothetical protein [Paludisphaera mucosa]MDG3003299.1 hypothetical protein [Paludisphaera mucosa]